MYIFRRLLLAVATLLVASSVQAEPSTPPTQQLPTAGYLGVGVDKVPASIRAHFPAEVAESQGLLVTRFADESPAADDGIKQYDVLISYDDQLIDDPEKFISQVRNDKPGRVVKFKLVRQGEILTVPVTIGEQKVTPPVAQVPRMQPQMPYPYQYPYRPMPNVPANMPPQGKTPPKANFNGLAIRRIGEDTYDASIGFVAADGTRQRRSYKGTREQILQQVMNARDLPPGERQQLIFAIKPRKKSSSGWGNMPFGDFDKFSPGRFFKGWGW